MLVKADTAKAVAFLVVVGRIELSAGCGEVEPLTVGREGGRILGPVLPHEQRILQEGACLCVIDKHVGRRVVHLDALVPTRMEHLRSLVGREGAEAAAGMPIGVDHRATQCVVLGFQQFHGAVSLHGRTSILPTDMEHVLAWIGAVSRMTVDALPADVLVLHQRGLVEVRQTALVQSHLPVHLVARGNAPVSDAPLAYRVGADINGEVAVAQPATLQTGTDRHHQAVATV